MPTTCPRRRFVRVGAKKPCDHLLTSYERSYYYQSPSPWSLQKQPQHKVRFKTELESKPSKGEELFLKHNYTSSYNKDYELKLIKDRSETYRRSSIAAKTTLKNLYEQFWKDPVRPLTYSTTTG
ncbi:hypothetical protein M0802_011046 [Mischocyttarus mexicanus]|nr:hypothetical protein M0802_011046 [Mischocyttarus mexicanus]